MLNNIFFNALKINDHKSLHEDRILTLEMGCLRFFQSSNIKFNEWVLSHRTLFSGLGLLPGFLGFLLLLLFCFVFWVFWVFCKRQISMASSMAFISHSLTQGSFYHCLILSLAFSFLLPLKLRTNQTVILFIANNHIKKTKDSKQQQKRKVRKVIGLSKIYCSYLCLQFLTLL